MHLISVDLPAPLSPTSAMTSPLDTWKSTSNSAWTAPNLFETPCSSRTGVSVTISAPPRPRRIRGRPGRDAPRHSLLKADVLALGGDLAGADLLHLGEVDLAGVLLDVVLGHGTGLSRIAGTSLVWLLTLSVTPCGVSPLASAIASLEAASASFLIAL